MQAPLHAVLRAIAATGRRLRSAAHRAFGAGAPAAAGAEAGATEAEAAAEADWLRLRVRILDRLIARGGHALGNHLQPILTFSRLAMEDVPPETRAKYLGYVHESGEQIQSLIAVARIVARRDRARDAGGEAVSIDHLIEDAEDVCPMLLPLDVAVRSDVQAANAQVWGSRADLMMALLGLILDAGDSMARKGEIVLRVSRADAADRLARPGAGLCLRLDVESSGERRDGWVPFAGGGVIAGLVARWGGGLGVARPAPEVMQVSLTLPEWDAGGPPAA